MIGKMFVTRRGPFGQLEKGETGTNEQPHHIKYLTPPIQLPRPRRNASVGRAPGEYSPPAYQYQTHPVMCSEPFGIAREQK